MNRRSFMGSILIACAAPAIVRADSLMRIVPRDTKLLLADYPWPLTQYTEYTMGRPTAFGYQVEITAIDDRFRKFIYVSQVHLRVD